MPAVHGRVCYHPCEDSCNRRHLDSAVSIHAVERFLGDLAIEEGWQLRTRDRDADRQARLVVGAGPCGLSAAYHLARLGHAVEIRDAGPLPGGMMHFGIPAYRMPRDVLEAEISRIEELGVKIVLDHKVEDLDAEMTDGRFDAVLHRDRRASLASGPRSRRATPARCSTRSRFLRDVETHEAPKLGRGRGLRRRQHGHGRGARGRRLGATRR